MSRIGKKPVAVLDGVDVKMNGRTVEVKGPKGQLAFEVPGEIAVAVENGEVVVSRSDDARQTRAFHGLTRSLIQNMVQGVKEPFEKRLEINGTGYQAQLAGKTLKLQVGFANTIELAIPEGVEVEVPKPVEVVVRSPDKQKCGQFAAIVRSARPPEPYKGKGIKYSDEVIKRKAGKANVS